MINWNILKCVMDILLYMSVVQVLHWLKYYLWSCPSFQCVSFSLQCCTKERTEDDLFNYCVCLGHPLPFSLRFTTSIILLKNNLHNSSAWITVVRWFLLHCSCGITCGIYRYLSLPGIPFQRALPGYHGSVTNTPLLPHITDPCCYPQLHTSQLSRSYRPFNG